jgi:uracil-DNA glycosylase
MKVEACRGQVFQWEGRNILATYHPASILHETESRRRLQKKAAVWQDLLPLREYLGIP